MTKRRYHGPGASAPKRSMSKITLYAAPWLQRAQGQPDRDGMVVMKRRVSSTRNTVRYVDPYGVGAFI